MSCAPRFSSTHRSANVADDRKLPTCGRTRFRAPWVTGPARNVATGGILGIDAMASWTRPCTSRATKISSVNRSASAAVTAGSWASVVTSATYRSVSASVRCVQIPTVAATTQRLVRTTRTPVVQRRTLCLPAPKGGAAATRATASSSARRRAFSSDRDVISSAGRPASPIAWWPSTYPFLERAVHSNATVPDRRPDRPARSARKVGTRAERISDGQAQPPAAPNEEDQMGVLWTIVTVVVVIALVSWLLRRT